MKKYVYFVVIEQGSPHQKQSSIITADTLITTLKQLSDLRDTLIDSYNFDKINTAITAFNFLHEVEDE